MSDRIETRGISNVAYVVVLDGPVVGRERVLVEAELDGLIDHGARSVVVDMTGAEDFDVAALGVLRRIASDLRGLGGELQLAARDPYSGRYMLKAVPSDGLSAVAGLHPALDWALSIEASGDRQGGSAGRAK